GTRMSTETVVQNLLTLISLFSAAIGGILSWLGENTPWFKSGSPQELTPAVKKIVVIVISIIVAVGGFVFANFVDPADVTKWNQPVTGIITLIAALVGSQVWHIAVNKNASNKTGPGG